MAKMINQHKLKNLLEAWEVLVFQALEICCLSNSNQMITLCYEPRFINASNHHIGCYISKCHIFYAQFKSPCRNNERVKPYTLPDKKIQKLTNKSNFWLFR